VPTIRVPDPLRRYAGGAVSFPVAGGTVAEALADAFRLHPDLRLRLVVFRNEGELARAGLESANLEPSDTLTFLEAIGGGQGGR
jgi:hypothetical protein